MASKRPTKPTVVELFPTAAPEKRSSPFEHFNISGETHKALSDMFAGHATHFRQMLISMGLPPMPISIYDDYVADTTPLLVSKKDDEALPCTMLIERSTSQGERWMHNALFDVREVEFRKAQLEKAIMSVVGRGQIRKYTPLIVKSTFAWMSGEVLARVVNDSCYCANRYGHYMSEVDVAHPVLNPGHYLLYQWRHDNESDEEYDEALEDERFRKGFGVLMLEQELQSNFGRSERGGLEDIIAVLRRSMWSAFTKDDRHPTNAEFALVHPSEPQRLKEIMKNFRLVTIPAVGDIALHELADTISISRRPRKK